MAAQKGALGGVLPDAMSWLIVSSEKNEKLLRIYDV
jgi:hypothetical protein